MDNSTQPNDTLMKYLDDELSRAEREDFEKRLAVDPALRQELEDLQGARAAIRMYGLKEQIASVHREMMAVTKPKSSVRRINQSRRIIRYSISIAASILLVLVCVVGYNFLTVSSGRLYKSQYHVYELASVRGSGAQTSELEEAYRQRRYDDVIQDRQKLQNPTPKDLFLSGIAYLETGDIPAAIASFKSVIEKNKADKTAVFNDDAEYYLALSYLRNKNYDEALDLIRVIRSKPDQLYHDQFSSGFVRKVKMLRWR